MFSFRVLPRVRQKGNIDRDRRPRKTEDPPGRVFSLFSLPLDSSVASLQLPSPALGELSWAVTVSPAWKPRLRYLKKGDLDGEGASAIDGTPDRSESISDAT
jgi:hypothetical protein